MAHDGVKNAAEEKDGYRGDASGEMEWNRMLALVMMSASG